MQKLSILLLALAAAGSLCHARAESLSLTTLEKGVHLLYYDTSATKRTITKSLLVEFRDYTVLLEMPISNAGSGSTNLCDHAEEGEDLLDFLHEHFPNKPLRYVCSSHWHPHSVSSIVPFITRGIALVTTRNNFARLSEMVDSAVYARAGEHIRFVEGDSVIIGDESNTIIAYRFSKAEYPSVPTEDFLYFYLPRYKYLHTSCMYQRLRGHPVRGRELISVRVEDLNRFITLRKLLPEKLITTDTWWDEADGTISGDTLRTLMRRGIGMYEIERELCALEPRTALQNSDSLISDWTENNIPAGMLNRAVYTLLSGREFDKALALAKLQAIMNPANPNAWDTLGEVYYYRGELTLAERYENQSKRIDKGYTSGGMERWRESLAAMRKKWGEEG